MLGDWPIEIGLWVGSDASPNLLGGRGKTGDHTAVTRVRRFKDRQERAGAAQGVPLVRHGLLGRQSFACVPNEQRRRRT